MKFWIKYPRNFSNEFDLVWSDDDSPKSKGYERITRSFAIEKCIQERRARKTDPQFSGFGCTYILPFEDEYALEDFLSERMDFVEIVGGYIVKPRYSN